MNIVLLLGSGISIPAGYPSIADITSNLLSGVGIAYDNNRFLLGAFQGEFARVWQRPSDERVKRVTEIISAIIEEIDDYYDDNRKINYEDIAYVAAQIRDSVWGEHDNPAVNALIKKLTPIIRPFFYIDIPEEVREKWEKQFSIEMLEKNQLRECFDDVVEYITDLLGRHLDILPTTTSHLAFITELANDTSTTLSGIITLNHDTMLEQYFDSQRIAYTCGFTSNGDQLCFDDGQFDDNSKICMVKLHGSIDWYYNPEVRRNIISDPHANILNPHPRVLIGTHNKMLEYTQGEFAPLFYEFIKRLRETDVLVISGYSFADKGVNSQIIYWMERHSKNRIVIIHGDPQALIANARGAMKNLLPPWKADGRLQFIAKYLDPDAPVTLADIKLAIEQLMG